ncbi:MAG: cupredoxin domain-containing protein [Armatimonadetes bacterium]|nr:cupredoxin domain-containing protein [Armatimonadota bacterium]
MINTRVLIALAVGAATLSITSAQMCGGCGGSSAPQGAPVQVQTDKKGVQKATIVVDGGFSPSSLTVKAGQPVELTFDTKKRGCASSVNFEGLNLKKDLTDGKKTVVSFTPKKAGTYTFACPMKMIKGTLIVK